MKTLNLNSVKDIRNLARKNDRNYLKFLDELEMILKTQIPEEWILRPLDGDKITFNEVWEQKLGTIKYRKKVHIFSCMYLPNQGVAIGEHGHNKFVHNGDVKKTKELYIFYIPHTLVEMKFCQKDETHELCNSYGKPVYVISVKVTGRG